jgi:hypothetical protein
MFLQQNIFNEFYLEGQFMEIRYRHAKMRVTFSCLRQKSEYDRQIGGRKKLFNRSTSTLLIDIKGALV